MTLPFTWADGDDLLAEQVIGNDEYLDSRFPVLDADVAEPSGSYAGINPAKGDWRGFKLPASSVPVHYVQSGSRDLFYVDSDPAITLANGIAFTKRGPSAGWPVASAGGFPFSAKDGVYIVSRNDHRVHLMRHVESDKFSVLKVEQTFQFPSGSFPVHGAALNSTQALVLCFGAYGVAQPSLWFATSGGGVTKVIDLPATLRSPWKVAVNRQGSHAYIACRAAGLSITNRVARVALGAPGLPVSIMTVGDGTGSGSITDIVMIPGPSASPDRLGSFLVSYNASIGTNRGVFLCRESADWMSWSPFPAAHDSQVHTVTAGGFGAEAMTATPGGAVVVESASSSTSTKFVAITVHSTSRGTQSFTRTVGESASVMPQSTPIVRGGAGFDGENVYVLTRSGGLITAPLWGRTKSSNGDGTTTPSGPGTWDAGEGWSGLGGLAWTGKSMVGLLTGSSQSVYLTI